MVWQSCTDDGLYSRRLEDAMKNVRNNHIVWAELQIWSDIYNKIKRYSCLYKSYLHTAAYIFVLTCPFETTSIVISLLKTASEHW